MRIEARTSEEAFEAFRQIIEAGQYPFAQDMGEKLIVKSTPQTIADDADLFDSEREWVVDYMTSDDDTVKFFEARGIELEDELL